MCVCGSTKVLPTICVWEVMMAVNCCSDLSGVAVKGKGSGRCCGIQPQRLHIMSSWVSTGTSGKRRAAAVSHTATDVCFLCLHTTQRRLRGGKCLVDVGGQRSPTQINTGYANRSSEHTTPPTLKQCIYIYTHFVRYLYLYWQGVPKAAGEYRSVLSAHFWRKWWGLNHVFSSVDSLNNPRMMLISEGSRIQVRI